LTLRSCKINSLDDAFCLEKIHHTRVEVLLEDDGEHNIKCKSNTHFKVLQCKKEDSRMLCHINQHLHRIRILLREAFCRQF